MQADEIQPLIDKLKELPPERVAEVEDFIDFLSQRAQDRALTQAAMSVSEPALEKIWDNDEDAVYDEL
ncbi:DUF2281 domain-containing protein [Wenzhouxiangella sp. EGI_FJ10409]|uniref:DUF2281 domain-containing protein n=1 Tax=Wenzhouxiangella sp. EGI_FJ10409 TaxID=3243767 RepID=UPI0035E1E215